MSLEGMVTVNADSSVQCQEVAERQNREPLTQYNPNR